MFAPEATASPQPPLRSDARATRRQLLDAVAALVAERGTDFNLSDVARRAGTSIATAYRHFTSKQDALDQVIESFASGVIAEADRSAHLAPTTRFETLCRGWVDNAVEWGPQAVLLRSPQGLLERYHAGHPLLVRLFDATTAILDAMIAGGHLPKQDTEYASFVWITLFDERNIVDLHRAAGWSPAAIARNLTATLLAALRSPPSTPASPHRNVNG